MSIAAYHGLQAREMARTNRADHEQNSLEHTLRLNLIMVERTNLLDIINSDIVAVADGPRNAQSLLPLLTIVRHLLAISMYRPVFPS